MSVREDTSPKASAYEVGGTVPFRLYLPSVPFRCWVNSEQAFVLSLFAHETCALTAMSPRP